MLPSRPPEVEVAEALGHPAAPGGRGAECGVPGAADDALLARHAHQGAGGGGAGWGWGGVVVGVGHGESGRIPGEMS